VTDRSCGLGRLSLRRCHACLGCLRILHFIQSTGGSERRLFSESTDLVTLNKYFVGYWTSEFATNSVDCRPRDLWSHVTNSSSYNKNGYYRSSIIMKLRVSYN
jgi:hypothetical protein